MNCPKCALGQFISLRTLLNITQSPAAEVAVLSGCEKWYENKERKRTVWVRKKS